MDPPTDRYNCVCSKHNFGQPHLVATATWYRHFQEAQSEEERQRMREARLLVPSGATTGKRGRAPARRRTNAPPAAKRPLEEQDDPENPSASGSNKRGRSETNSPPPAPDPPFQFQSPPQSPGFHQSPFQSPLQSPRPTRSPSRSPPRSDPPHSPPQSPPQSPRARSPRRSPPRPDSPRGPVHSRSQSPRPRSRTQSPHPGSPNPAQQNLRINYARRPRPDIDLDELTHLASFKPMTEGMSFVNALRNASTSDPVAKLSDTALERLRVPPNIPLVIDNPGVRHSISTYLALEHASQAAYEAVSRSVKRNFAGTPAVENILSFQQVEQLIRIHTGVEPILHDMCPRTCHAFTGPYSTLDHCYMCNASRWNEQRLQGSNGRIKIPAQQFTTIPLGPQLQARTRNPESARQMRYLWERTQSILEEIQRSRGGPIPVLDDVAMGWDYLGAVLDGDITEHDIVLMVSLDGAQLYDSKESDCWMYIWVILNLPPDKRYHKINVLPGGFIPGPDKPKNLDSFLFPGIHHVAALQREGLSMWDPLTDSRYISRLYLLFTTADGPGLVYWDGMVGHSGKNGCRLYCGVLGRRKEEGTHYYPALLAPRDHTVAGCDHEDINVMQLPPGGSAEYSQNLSKIVSVRNQRQWNQMKTETGLTKPPLILGLNPKHSLGVPLCMTTDIMHLAGNLSDILLSLWRGTLAATGNDNKDNWDWAILRDNEVWADHGKLVERVGQHLPGSFDRKPRNIAEKINTQYKTWEFHLYTFGYAPILLYNLLPLKYWKNFCRLVRGFQIMCQHSISQQQLQDAHILLCTWEREFELLYYQLKHDRIHFIRPAIHQVVHLVPEAIQKGPPICYAQWTMERTIGNLGQEIRQPSRPYANLAREGVRRCQVNALISILPELNEPPKGLPLSSIDLRDGYVLRHKRDKYSMLPDPAVAQVISSLLPPGQDMPRITKWARLQLPNGQIARSAWRELLQDGDRLRISRNVKFRLCDSIRCGEVQYYTQIAINDPQAGWTFRSVAILKPYSPADEKLLELSSQVVAASKLLEDILVVDVKNILSVVAMIPRCLVLPDKNLEDEYFCMLERPGLDISDLGVPYGVDMPVEEDNEADEEE